MTALDMSLASAVGVPAPWIATSLMAGVGFWSVGALSSGAAAAAVGMVAAGWGVHQ